MQFLAAWARRGRAHNQVRASVEAEARSRQALLDQNKEDHKREKWRPRTLEGCCPCPQS